MAKMVAPFGPQDGKRINIAVQRPNVNLKEAENLGEEAAAETRRNSLPTTLSKHATFGPRVETHPGLE